jgi:hypothetical protein
MNDESAETWDEATITLFKGNIRNKVEGGFIKSAKNLGLYTCTSRVTISHRVRFVPTATYFVQPDGSYLFNGSVETNLEVIMAYLSVQSMIFM